MGQVISDERYAAAGATSLDGGAARVARVIFAAFAFAIPLDVILASRLGTSSVVLGVPLAIAGAWQILSSRRVRKLPPSLILLIAFSGWCATSIAWATDLDAFATRLTTNAQLLAFVLLGWQICRSEREVRAALWGFVGGCVALAADTWRAYLTGEFVTRYTAEAFDANDMAVTLAIGIPMSAYLAARAPGRLGYLALAYVPIAVSGVALSASRGGALATAAAIIAVLLRGGLGRVTRLGLIALLIAGIVGSVSYVPETTWSRLLTIGDELSRGTMGDRVQIWRAGLQIVAEHPLIGVGAGGSKRAMVPLLNAPAAAHNTALAVALEVGAVGVVLFFGAFVAVIFAAARRAPGQGTLAWSLIATWGVGAASLSWDHRKTTWFVLLIAAATTRQAARVCIRRDHER